MLKWTKGMANPQTQRELKRLKINMKEEQLYADHGGWMLRARTVKTGTAPPLLPPGSSSV